MLIKENIHSFDHCITKSVRKFEILVYGIQVGLVLIFFNTVNVSAIVYISLYLAHLAGPEFLFLFILCFLFYCNALMLSSLLLLSIIFFSVRSMHMYCLTQCSILI